MTGAWTTFRSWPRWAQVAVWLLAWPVALGLLAASKPPGSRRPWVALAVAGAAVWIAAGVSGGRGDEREHVASSAPRSVEATTTTERAVASTTTVRPATTTTEPTTTTLPPTTTTRPPTTTTAPPPPPPTPPPPTAPPATAPQPVVTAPPVTAARSGGCHPSYTPCVPDVPGDLDCPDIGFEVHVIGPDVYGLDGNDDDGLGCESYG